MTMAVNPSQVTSPRFGWRAKGEDLKAIQTAAKKDFGNSPVASQYCFAESESSWGPINAVKKFVSGWHDYLILRWNLWRDGNGIFPKYVGKQTDVYSLRRFNSPESAAEAKKSLDTSASHFNELKRYMMAQAQNQRTFRHQVNSRLDKVSPADFGLSKALVDPFAVVSPLKINGLTEINKQSIGPEHFVPTVTVVAIDDKTLLTRTRLGPHA